MNARRPTPRARLTVGLAAAALAALAPAALAAQESPDFLFRRPVVSLTLRGGWNVPQTGSEIFEFTTQELTLEPGDFSAPSIGGELAWRATERLDVALSADFARSEATSEFRAFVEDNAAESAILQTTSFRRVPVMLNVKGYLFQRGRSVSRFAWVPTASWSPYAGVGAGFTWYTFEQTGDFVDYETLDIFYDRFISEGSAPTLQVLAGATVDLGRRLALNGEARYAWASTDLDRDFVDFDPIDLGGFQATAGLSLRF